MKVKDIAELVGGRVCGNGEVDIKKPAPIHEAEEGDITFFLNPKYKKYLTITQASCIVTPTGARVESKTTIEVENPHIAMIKILSLWELKPDFEGISSLAFIADDAKIDEGTTIYPFVFVGKQAKIGKSVRIFPGCFIGEEVEIGDRTVIYPNAVLYPRCKIGSNCIIHAGVVVGADGFGYIRFGEIIKIPQVGDVKIEDGVEIGANSAVDRATMGTTLIGGNTKVDNLVQIGHNVKIGRNVRIAGQTGIAGSSEVGDDTILAGQVGVSDHVKVGRGVIAGARCGIVNNVEDGTIVFGVPAMERKKWLRAHAAYSILPEILERLRKVEKELGIK